MWVLLFYLGAGYGGGMTTVDGFTSESHCQNAEAKVVAKFKSIGVSVKTLCIKKD